MRTNTNQIILNTLSKKFKQIKTLSNVNNQQNQKEMLVKV